MLPKIKAITELQAIQSIIKDMRFLVFSLLAAFVATVSGQTTTCPLPGTACSTDLNQTCCIGFVNQQGYSECDNGHWQYNNCPDGTNCVVVSSNGGTGTQVQCQA